MNPSHRLNFGPSIGHDAEAGTIVSQELLTVLVIMGAALVLFVSDRVRIDAVALLVVLALAISGVLTPVQALSGFADPLVVMIAGLFVVSAALSNTGVAARVGEWLAGVAGGSPTRMIVALMLTTGLLSALMSSTGTIAVMLPVILKLAARSGVSASKLLMPASYAALLGGMLTLIATPPNLVASQTLQENGLDRLGFFALTPIGLALLVVAVIYMATAGRGLLPDRAGAAAMESGPERVSVGEVAERFDLARRLYRAVVPEGHELVGRTLGELRLPETSGVRVIAIDTDPEAVSARRRSRKHLDASKRIGAETTIAAADRLIINGDPEALERFAERYRLSLHELDLDVGRQLPANLTFVELLIPPRSHWLGKTLRDMRFRERYRLVAVALRRGTTVLADGIGNERLRFGDIVLARGRAEAIEALRAERSDAIVLSEAPGSEPPAPAAAKAPFAVGIVLAMLVVMSTTGLPLVVVTLIAVLALVFTGCVGAEEAYTSVRWSTVVVIAGLLPLATAFEDSGGATMLAQQLNDSLGGYGPTLLLTAIYVTTVVATTFLSNTTSAVLIAPIAFQVSQTAGLAAAPFLVAVAIGASSSFISPVSSPVNAIVLGPGQYRFSDFVKVGGLMQLVITLVSILLIPLFFPF